MSSAPVARRAERRRKELMARQRGHRLASEPKRHGLAQAQLVQPWASPRPGSQTERGEPAGIHAVPYVEAPGLTDRRQSGRRINPLPGGWTRGFGLPRQATRPAAYVAVISQTLRRTAGYASACADWRPAGRRTLTAGPVR